MDNMAEEPATGPDLASEGIGHLLIVGGHNRGRVKVLIISSYLKIVFLSMFQSSQG